MVNNDKYILKMKTKLFLLSTGADQFSDNCLAIDNFSGTILKLFCCNIQFNFVEIQTSLKLRSIVSCEY
jgi:hypothetical protein